MRRLPIRDREQRLAQRVVDLVRAGVREVLALQEDARAAGTPPTAAGFGDRRGASDVVLQQPGELGVEMPDRRGRRSRRARALRPVRPASRARSARRTRRSSRVCQDRGGMCWPFSASKSARRRAGSLMPGDDSTPDDTSMPKGRTRAMASATLSGVSPPASRRPPLRRDRRGGGPVDRAAGAAALDRIVHIQQQRRRRGHMSIRLDVGGLSDRHGFDDRARDARRVRQGPRRRAAARRRA